MTLGWLFGESTRTVKMTYYELIKRIFENTTDLEQEVVIRLVKRDDEGCVCDAKVLKEVRFAIGVITVEDR
jgi:hypothetical protein